MLGRLTGDHRGRDRRRAGRALRRVARAHAGPARPAVHRGRAAHAVGQSAHRGVAGRAVRGQGGAGQGARRAGRPALARRRGDVGEHGRPHLEVRGTRRRPRGAARRHVAGTSRSATTAASPRRWSSPRASPRGDDGDRPPHGGGGPGRRGAAARRRHPRARSCSGPPPGWPPSASACSAASTAAASPCSSARATTAATPCSPVRSSPGRGARVTAVLLDPERAHAAGLAALRRDGRTRAAGRQSPGPSTGSPAPTWCSTACSASAAGAGCARTPPTSPAPPPTAPGLTVAVDVPSGVDADTGAVDGRGLPGHAHRDLRRGQARPGRGGGPRLRRRGAPRRHRPGPHLPPATAFRLTDADVAARLAPPSAGDDKYSQGVVGIVAGLGDLSRGRRAVHRRRAAHPARAWSATPGRRPTASGPRGRRRSSPTAGPADAGRVQAWVVGPGMGTDDDARSVLAEVLGTDLPVVVDADALTMLARGAGPRPRPHGAPTVLTPHDREFARFGAEPGGDRVGAARRLAADLGCAVLLKGDATVVADADGTAFVNATGTPWLATAGTGDVLSGHRRRAAGHRPARRARRAPSPPTCTAGPGSSPPSADRCSPATWSADCPRRSAGCAGSRGAAWETRRRDATAAGPRRGGRRPRRHRRQHRGAPRARRPPADGRGQGRRLRPRPGPGGPRRAGRRRGLPRRRRPRGGAGAARRGHHRAGAGLAARPGHRLRRRRSPPTSRSR